MIIRAPSTDDINTGKVLPGQVTVVEGHFGLTDEDKAELPAEFRQYDYVFGRRLDNSFWHDFLGAPPAKKYADIKKDLIRFCAHIDSRMPKPEAGMSPDDPPSTRIIALAHDWKDDYELEGQPARLLKEAIEKSLPYVEEGNAVEEKRYDDLIATIAASDARSVALWNMGRRLPLFIRFRDFLRVRPLIHLEHLATRIERNLIDDEYYDYGNKCLLKLLGFSARELSNLGRTRRTLHGRPSRASDLPRPTRSPFLSTQRRQCEVDRRIARHLDARFETR